MKFQVKYNPHSDLANLAQYQLDGIEKKQKSKDNIGLGLDMQACLISQAFLAEALVNMAGFGLFRENFKEKQSYYLKRQQVFSELSVEHITDLNSVLNALQSARNDLAHAKPSRYEYELKDNENEFAVFNRPFDDLLNVDFLKHTNKVLDELWLVIANNELIEEYGLITSAVEVG